MGRGDGSREAAEAATKEARIDGATKALQAFGEQHGLRGLEGRVQRGLDPAGMLAVPETRAELEQVVDKLGASMDDVIKLTNELHVGGIWQNAERLAAAEDGDVKAWIIAGEATTSGKETEGDLDQD